jgi:hypothetical protein
LKILRFVPNAQLIVAPRFFKAQTSSNPNLVWLWTGLRAAAKTISRMIAFKSTLPTPSAK